MPTTAPDGEVETETATTTATEETTGIEGEEERPGSLEDLLRVGAAALDTSAIGVDLRYRGAETSIRLGDPPSEGGPEGCTTVPVVRRGRVIGVLWAARPDCSAWPTEEVAALERLATALARDVGRRPSGGPASEPGPAPRTGRSLPSPEVARSKRRRARPAQARSRLRPSEVETWLRGAAEEDGIGSRTGEPQLTGWLLERLREGLHVGFLNPGDRLPSMRQLARGLGVTGYTIGQAYGRAAAVGLVEARERSGVYVSGPPSETPAPASDTVAWMVSVLGEAIEHRLKIPQLPALLERWTLGRPLRCACLESTEDARVGLCREVEEVYGLRANAVVLSPEAAAWGSGSKSAPAAVRDADVLLSTSYHPEVRDLARRMDKPDVAIALDPRVSGALRAHLREHAELSFVCVDPAFGRRFQSALAGGSFRDRITVVPAGDDRAVAALDPRIPVYLTAAAQGQLAGGASFRLVAPPFPAFAPESARRLISLIVRHNVRSGRIVTAEG